MSPTPERRLASRLRRRGLDAPARLLADAHRPLAPLLADLGAAVGPLLGAAGMSGAARLLSQERPLDALIEALDAGEDHDVRSR
ncbi:MAG: hypothetical protein KY392_00195 [Chloroflexi bacterium]|nr:hypothetical protein [Chloroflexota bacterium]